MIFIWCVCNECVCCCCCCYSFFHFTFMPSQYTFSTVKCSICKLLYFKMFLFMISNFFFSPLALPFVSNEPTRFFSCTREKETRNWEKESDEWVSAGSTSNSFACNMKLHSFRLHLIEWLLFSTVLREIESHRRRPKSCHVWLRQLESVFFGFSANDIKFVWTHPCRFYHPIWPDPNYFHSLSLSLDAKGDFRWVLLQSSYVIREALNLFDSVQ